MIDEDGMLEYITIESAIMVESVGSGDIGATVVAMETSGHMNNRHYMGGSSDHVNLDHNYSPYNSFDLMMSKEFGAVFCRNSRTREQQWIVLEGRVIGTEQSIQTSLPSHRRTFIFI